jgi:mRNA-degrading endonuclease toxin of MazEF toxin-antitoxin module
MRGQLRWVELAPDRHRPYLVVQSDVLNDTAPTTVGLPVTLTPQRAGYPLTVALDDTTAGLGRPAWIRVTQPSTLRAAQIGETIATLPPEHLQRVLHALATILDLPTPGSSPHPTQTGDYDRA